jgi:hypothetical protein
MFEAALGYHLTLKSTNKKTGPIPVSTTTAETCPTDCPFNHANAGGCYAASGPLALFWAQITNGTKGVSYDVFLTSVSALALGTLWRHDQAGDLPGKGNVIDVADLMRLVEANRGKRGFTYTHKPVLGDSLLARTNRAAVADANANGFTVNLSGNNLAHADELAALAIGPVVTVLPSTVHGNVKVETPQGRRVVVCPATYRDNVTCMTCGLCQVRDRKVIVGFPAHGSAKSKADTVARTETSAHAISA